MFRLVSIVEIGAGAAISSGRKMRMLTANRANKKINSTINGAIFCLKKLIKLSVRTEFKRDGIFTVNLLLS